MKMEIRDVRCAMCGEESEQKIIMSNSMFGQPDLDMRPTGSMASLGEGIQECPYCHYCNFDIGLFIQERFKLTPKPIEIWNSYEEVQELIEEEPEEDARKFRIMAEQYYGNLDYHSTFDMMVKAYWSSSIKEHKNQYLSDALSLFNYTILEDEIKKYIQLADLSRQNRDFDEASQFLSVVKSLFKNLPEDTEATTTNFFETCIEFEEELLNKKDDKKHNLSEY